LEGKELAFFAAAVAEDKKAQDLLILDLKGISMVTDYFLICSGNSLTQVKAVAEEIEKQLEEKEIRPLNQRRLPESGWILLDYGDVIVHVMRREERNFYQLEKLWGDGEIIFQANFNIDR